MILLLWIEALVGMMLVVAVLRSHHTRQIYAGEDSEESKIHLVASRPVSLPVQGPLERCLLLLMRQFAVHVLGAQWRAREPWTAVVTRPYGDRTRQSPRSPV
jgi:hypothetical protein